MGVPCALESLSAAGAGPPALFLPRARIGGPPPGPVAGAALPLAAAAAGLAAEMVGMSGVAAGAAAEAAAGVRCLAAAPVLRVLSTARTSDCGGGRTRGGSGADRVERNPQKSKGGHGRTSSI